MFLSVKLQALEELFMGYFQMHQPFQDSNLKCLVQYQP